MVCNDLTAISRCQVVLFITVLINCVVMTDISSYLSRSNMPVVIVIVQDLFIINMVQDSCHDKNANMLGFFTFSVFGITRFRINTKQSVRDVYLVSI